MNWFWLNLSSLVRFLLFGFSLPNESTRLWYFVDVETETHRDWQIYWMSRPRLIETEKFLGCRDRDSSRLRNFLDVETETHQDWEISWMLKSILIETGKFIGCRDRDQSRLGKRFRYRDSIEILPDLWCFPLPFQNVQKFYIPKKNGR